FWKSLAMVWLGNLTAGAIVTVLAVFLKNYMNAVLDIFFIIVILVLWLYIVRVAVKMIKNKKNKENDKSRVVESSSITADAEVKSDETGTTEEIEIEENCEKEATDISVTAKVSEKRKEEEK
ncbi:MAG: hypothetical protein K2N32_05270, partial [Clostridia bacterium]|nr:hypothetical protein [Clostridia bacterium]